MNFIDNTLGRTPSWRGAIVHVLDPTNPDYGKHVQVTDSWYQDQQNWHLWWDSNKPIDPDTVSKKTKVYEYKGKWDMALRWSGVAIWPLKVLAVCIPLIALCAALDGNGGAAVLVLGCTIPAIALMTMRLREPVLGAKIGAGVLVVAAYQEHQKAEQEREARMLGWNSASEMVMKGGQGMRKDDWTARFANPHNSPQSTVEALNRLGLYYGGPR